MTPAARPEDVVALAGPPLKDRLGHSAGEATAPAVGCLLFPDGSPLFWPVGTPDQLRCVEKWLGLRRAPRHLIGREPAGHSFRRAAYPGDIDELATDELAHRVTWKGRDGDDPLWAPVGTELLANSDEDPFGIEVLLLGWDDDGHDFLAPSPGRYSDDSRL